MIHLVLALSKEEQSLKAARGNAVALKINGTLDVLNHTLLIMSHSGTVVCKYWIWTHKWSMLVKPIKPIKDKCKILFQLLSDNCNR